METQSQEPRELSSEETELIQDSLQLGYAICEHYLGLDGSDIVASDLDDAYIAWLDDEAEDKPSEDDVVYGLGAVLGELFLTHQYGQTLSWKVVFFDAEPEYAIAQHGSDLQVYPFSFVYKRVAEREPQAGFFAALYDTMGKELES